MQIILDEIDEVEGEYEDLLHGLDRMWWEAIWMLTKVAAIFIHYSPALKIETTRIVSNQMRQQSTIMSIKNSQI